MYKIISLLESDGNAQMALWIINVVINIILLVSWIVASVINPILLLLSVFIIPYIFICIIAFRNGIDIQGDYIEHHRIDWYDDWLESRRTVKRLLKIIELQNKLKQVKTL